MFYVCSYIGILTYVTPKERPNKPPMNQLPPIIVSVTDIFDKVEVLTVPASGPIPSWQLL